MKKIVSPLSVALFIGFGSAAATAAMGTAPVAETAAPLPAPLTQLAQAAPAPAAPAEIDPALMEEGATLFRQNCSSCHGSSGEGGGAPRLAGSTSLESETLILNQVLFGSEYMPAFAAQLDDHQVAAIGTFIRNSWGNAYPAITEESVAAVRP